MFLIQKNLKKFKFDEKIERIRKIGKIRILTDDVIGK
jgi:hypothetical protein